MESNIIGELLINPYLTQQEIADKLGVGRRTVICTEDDSYYSSVYLEAPNEAGCSCIEKGAICEAHKYNKRVAHCICIIRNNENFKFQVLLPYGICQERLRYWGYKVKAGVTTNDDILLFVELKELQPYHWSNAYNETDN